MQKVLKKRLPELIELDSLIAKLGDQAKVSVLAEVPYDGHVFPIYAIEIGSQDPTAPCFAMVGSICSPGLLLPMK